jgi:hypothetical protein
MFQILQPCNERRWEELPVDAGDARRRYCDVCSRHVHAMARYSAEEWAELSAGGKRVCGMLAEAPLPSRRRWMVWASWMAAARMAWARGESSLLIVKVVDPSRAALPEAVCNSASWWAIVGSAQNGRDGSGGIRFADWRGMWTCTRSGLGRSQHNFGLR